MGAAEFIERRMASELDAATEAAGQDYKKNLALGRLHDKWESRHPEIFAEYWDSLLRELSGKLSSRFDYNSGPPALRLIRS